MGLNDYLEQFRTLRVHKAGSRASPHRVCMLYAVMDLIEEGAIQWNVIYFDEHLKRRYHWYFDQLSGLNDKANPHYPFYHLRSEGFWHHDVKPEQAERYETLSTSVTERFVREVIAYAYLDDELFTLMRNPAARAAMKRTLAENLSNHEERFKRWCLNIGKSEKTANNYISALKKPIPQMLNIQEDNLMLVSDYFRILAITNQAPKVDKFVEYNTRGKGMYSAALRLYLNYLDDLTRSSVEHDVAIITDDATIEPTQKEVLIQARRGQGKFRERLIGQWKKCAVTGYSNLSFLIASHIKPWATSNNRERLDPYNGLLLIPNLDKAFDLHYISFDERGKILISDYLENYELLGIHKEMSIQLARDHQEYLEHHRDEFRRH